MTVGFMLLAILFLALVVDSGRLYLDKRSLQRVADMAALEAVSRASGCSAAFVTNAQQVATASAQRNGFVVANGRTLLAECGTVGVMGGQRQLMLDASQNEAVRVTVTARVPASLVAGGIFDQDIVMQAQATAARASNQLAQLTIRSQVLAVDSSRGTLLNALIGGLLGSNLNVSVAGWQGLVGTNISLFEFSNQLSTNLGLSVGSYDQLLRSNITVGQLVNAAIDVLQRNGSASSSTMTALQSIRVASAVSPTPIRLGDVVNLAAGSEASGLTGQINLFNLLQGFAQAANANSALAADVPISLPGLLSANAKVKITEPPQLSAVGNPDAAKLNPDGPDAIFVRTAQARVLISIELGNVLISNLQPLLNALNTVNNNALVNATAELLGGNFVGFVGGVVGGLLGILLPPNGTPRDEVDIKVPSPLRIDIYVDGGGANAKLTDFSCQGANKSVTTNTNAYTAKVLIGNLGRTYADAVNNAFSSNNPLLNAGPVPILDIGAITVRQRCRSGNCFGNSNNVVTEYSRAANGAFTPSSNVTENRNLAFRTPFKGGGIGIDFINPSIFAKNEQLAFQNPPAVNSPLADPGDYRVISADNARLVNSLSSSLSNVQIKVFQPGTSNLLGNTLATSGTVVSQVSSAARNLISGILSPLIDPILNTVMQQLGVNIANAELAAQLTCGDDSGVRLIQ
jgi:uncharacterized membrane protein